MRHVALPHAPHAVGQLIHVAQSQGVSHARINLRPAELGGIEVRLATDAAGLTATVVADSAHAAQVLQGSVDDLRRQLERAGVTVSSLEISTANPDAGTTTGDGERPAGDSGGPGRRSSADGQEPAPAERGAEQTLTLPDGVLVDVLA